MRILIADDEARARRRLAEMLADHSEVEICGEAGDGISALEVIERLNPDVVLIDVQMSGLDGFEVIRELSGPKVPPIIFVTGNHKYAIQVFEVSAVDFLLKPYNRGSAESGAGEGGADPSEGIGTPEPGSDSANSSPDRSARCRSDFVCLASGRAAQVEISNPAGLGFSGLLMHR
jgi:two-component system LytT family response regulator